MERRAREGTSGVERSEEVSGREGRGAEAPPLGALLAGASELGVEGAERMLKLGTVGGGGGVSSFSPPSASSGKTQRSHFSLQ